MPSKVLGPKLLELDVPLRPAATVGLEQRYRRDAKGGAMEQAMLVEYLAGVCDALGIAYERVIGFDEHRGLRVQATADEIREVTPF